MKYITYIDKPILSSFVIDELYKQLEGVTFTSSYHDVPYMIVEGSSSLYQAARDTFNNVHVYVGIQIIMGDLPIHVDINAYKTNKYNYLIELGGNDVVTSFFDEQDRLVEQTVIEKERWHFIDVTKKHSVKNVTSRRLSLMVGILK